MYNHVLNPEQVDFPTTLIKCVLPNIAEKYVRDMNKAKLKKSAESNTYFMQYIT